MMQMLSPDLLDRRALALIELVDYAGKAISAPARFEGDGIRIFSKGSGRYALLEAPDFPAYTASFIPTPSVPAVGSKAPKIDIMLANPHYMSRQVELRLPRDADPVARDSADSIFQPLRITLLPTSGAPVPATAAAVRVSVVHKTNKKCVGNALVRVKSANGKFAGAAMTDVSGEALVIIPYFPISFTTGAAAIEDSLAATVSVVADPQSVVLSDPAGSFFGTAPLADPDKIATQFPAPATGTSVRLSTRRTEVVKLEWNPP